MIPFNTVSRFTFLSVLALALSACASSKDNKISAQESADPGPAIVYELGKLPYAYSALEPIIDAKTMEIHYSKHHKAYVDNLNKALAGTRWASVPLKQIFARISEVPAAIRNNGGGHYNHTVFWSIMTSPKKSGQPSAPLKAAIVRAFGSLEAMQEKFNQAAATRFGSGWAWLVVQKDGTLAITSTGNQDNPLMEVADLQGYPILALDVWEHAYYLKYQNRRADYSKEWWKLVNWAEVSRRFSDKPKLF